jgi:uncharacterized membrane protein
MSANQLVEDADEKETGRIEAFSDGVIAIAITLLAFDLRVPDAKAHSNLLAALLDQWPDYLAFLAGFATILVMWINHHRMFSAIHRSDDILLILNGLLLLGITVVPFTTKLVAEYLQTDQASMAVAIYAGWSVILAIFFNFLWRYVANNQRLFSRKVDLSLVSYISWQYAFGPIFYLVALIAAFISPALGLLICMGLAVFFSLPNKQYQALNKST